MLRRFRDRFGAAGLAVAIAALTLAIGGTALAASGALTAKQKKEVKKIAKSFQGTGPIGPQGPKGDPGPAGKDGSNGAPGNDGTDGVDGADGTFSTEPLPTGETLTGIWSAAGASDTETLAPISFPIAVSPPPTLYFEVPNLTAAVKLAPNAKVTSLADIITPEEFEQACPGSAAAPEAASGAVCVYVGEEKQVSTGLGDLAEYLTGPSSFGVSVPTKYTGGAGYITGTWAVTAGP